MNYREIVNQIINLKVLYITHSLNLTAFVFGFCDPEGRVLENCYGLQLNCPWVIKDVKDGRYIAASGDLFGPPRDFGKITGDIQKWHFNYTLLDENLEGIRKKELCVKEIGISKHGDLKVVFSEQIELYAFTDFSCEKEGWWLYKCSGVYMAPLRKKGLAGDLVTANDSWWLLINRSGSLFYSDDTSLKPQKVQIDRQAEYETACDNPPSFLTEVLGGTLIEVGRKKVNMLQEAPTSWLKIRVGEKGKDNRIVSIYFDCPWRICGRDEENILIAAADIRGDCLWNHDSLKPTLRECDHYDEKVRVIEGLDLKVTKAVLPENGNIVLNFGEQYWFQSFISWSEDPVVWRMYCSGTNEYYQGGNGFTEHLMKKETAAVKSRPEDVSRYLQKLEDYELISVVRKGTCCSFSFSGKKGTTSDGNRNPVIQLICCESSWRLWDNKTRSVILGGGDCRIPSPEYEDLDDITWYQTVNTRFEQAVPYLFNEEMHVTKAEVSRTGDLQICFSDERKFEFFTAVSSETEQWFIKEGSDVCLRSFGRVIALKEGTAWFEPDYTDRFSFLSGIGRTNPDLNRKTMKVKRVRKNNSKELLPGEGETWPPEILNETNLPWRLYDGEKEMIILGTGDTNYPAEGIEWEAFVEGEEWRSMFGDKWDRIKDMNLLIQTADVRDTGDIVLNLTSGIICQIFNNFGDEIQIG